MKNNCYELIRDCINIDSLFKPYFQLEVVPDGPGVYCIRLNIENALSDNYTSILKERNHKILYIGIAKSLKKRLQQEVEGEGHGTFFRIIGPLLDYYPEKGSLKELKNKNNYTFSNLNRSLIVEWNNQNLQIFFISCFNPDIKEIEKLLIQSFLPLLNTYHNPAKLKSIKELRLKCRKIAME